MNSSTISPPALQLIELTQSNDVLRTIAEDSPELFASLIQAAEVAAKMSSDRSQLIAGITRAADASDRVIEAIRSGNIIELAERMQTAACAIADLSEAFKKFFPAAIATSSSANSAAN
jgi:ABC-type transporter Mla subunit MlaD